MPYSVFIDDSGTTGVVFDLKGNATPTPHGQPVMTVCGLIVNDRAIPAIEQRWEALRSRIRDELALDYLPPIHLRLMYGKKLKPTHRGRPNVYVQATFEQIKDWIRAACQIIDDHQMDGTVRVVPITEKREDLQEWMRGYYESDLFKEEYGYLQSLPRYKAAVNAFHDSVANPHVELLGQVLLHVHDQLRKRPGGSARVYYDRNPSSRGFDVLSAADRFRSAYGLDTLIDFSEADEDGTPLLQAADLCCYRVNRRSFRQVTGNSDPFMEELDRDVPLPELATRKSFTDKVRLAVIRYEIAWIAALAADGEFTLSHFLNSTELLERNAETMRRNGSGLSIIRSKTP